MSTLCVVGYCPELYDALQMVAHQELPYEPIDEWPPHARQYNESDRQVLIEKLLSALGNDDEDLDKELKHYLTVLFEAINDEELRELVLQGTIINMMIDERGFYLVEHK